MKSKANFILFFVWINCFAQDQNTSTPVNPALLREIISQGHLANNLIYTYSDWCAPCVKEFPRVIDFCKTNNVGLYIIVLSKEGNADLSKLEAKFEKKYSLVSPNLFNFKYDKQYLNLKTKNNFKNYQAFIAELLAENYHADYIYGWDILILTNQQGQTKIVSADGSFDDILKRLKSNL